MKIFKSFEEKIIECISIVNRSMADGFTVEDIANQSILSKYGNISPELWTFVYGVNTFYNEKYLAKEMQINAIKKEAEQQTNELNKKNKEYGNNLRTLNEKIAKIKEREDELIKLEKVRENIPAQQAELNRLQSQLLKLQRDLDQKENKIQEKEKSLETKEEEIITKARKGYLKTRCYFPPGDDEWRPIKILCLGIAATGKTTFIQNIVYGSFGMDEKKFLEDNRTPTFDETHKFVGVFKYSYNLCSADRIQPVGIQLMDVGGDHHHHWAAALSYHHTTLDGLIIFTDLAQTYVEDLEKKTVVSFEQIDDPTKYVNDRIEDNRIGLKKPLQMVLGQLEGAQQRALKGILFVCNKTDLLRPYDIQKFFNQESINKFIEQKYSSIRGDITKYSDEKFKIPLLISNGSARESGNLKVDFHKFINLILKRFDEKGHGYDDFRRWRYTNDHIL